MCIFSHADLQPPFPIFVVGCVCVHVCVWGMVRVMWEREADVGGLGLDCCRGGLAGVGERCRRNERICVCVGLHGQRMRGSGWVAPNLFSTVK